jgi:transcriptional regulator with XRE-family HTH domain
LNRLRKQSGLTYAQLAEAGKVSKGMISHFCRGRTITCRRETGELIEGALDKALKEKGFLGVRRGTLFRDPDYETLRTRRGARTLNPLPLERTIDTKRK